MTALRPETERLPEPLTIRRMHNDRAPWWIVKRIGALALARDGASVERFHKIPVELDRLAVPKS
ncbi:hypothetical protein [Sphingomonas immobilis]|uniref:Uncharacterized protein n=1 Tax=Sphingomonas immobilis TaxID=3063997 RepID=A0ABT8ZW71_9SPHN|nr:hypothetical protein [Sphingomonas sp. CA1-15]MDO7841827.1 hypothetical protein [Sphingomonas sp. CA1-15]